MWQPTCGQMRYCASFRFLLTFSFYAILTCSWTLFHQKLGTKASEVLWKIPALQKKNASESVLTQCWHSTSKDFAPAVATKFRIL